MTGRPTPKPLPPAPARAWLSLVRWASRRGAARSCAKATATSDTDPASADPAPIPLNLRRAGTADATSLSALMHTLSHHLLERPSPDELQAFEQEISAERMAEVLDQRNHVFVVATQAQAGEEAQAQGIAGFIGIRDGRHVSHFFVAPGLQGRGIGRQLWHEVQRVLRATETTVFTVDASPGAVAVYEKLGFRMTGQAAQRGGLAFVPMRGLARRPVRRAAAVHPLDDA